MTDSSRILVVRTDRLGDVVLTLPLLPLLRRRFPKAHLGMLVGAYAGGIVEGNPDVDELIWYDGPEGMIPFGAMLRTIRARRFDACLVVHPTARLAWIMALAGIPLRVGTGYRLYSFLFNERVYTHRKTAERHEVEYNIELAQRIGCSVPAGFVPRFTIVIPEEARNSVEKIFLDHGIHAGDRVVVIHPGSGGSAREWPLEYFAGLARQLAGEPGVRVIVTGNRREFDRAASVAVGAGAGGVNLAGTLTLKELAALSARAALFVSNSTGPLHVAAALGTPVLGFYPQIPVMGARRWGPYSANARVLSPDRPRDCGECTGAPGSVCACMASISVETAFAAAAELLAPARRSQNSPAHG